MINPRWLEVPLSRTIFYGPNDVRAIEVRLYIMLLVTWPLFVSLDAFSMDRRTCRLNRNSEYFE